MLLNTTAPYTRLIQTSASEWWHEQSGPTSSNALIRFVLIKSIFILNRVDLTLYNKVILHLLLPEIEVRVIELPETHL